MVIVCPLVYIWGFYICMHTTMANQVYEKEWKKFLKCNMCWEIKELSLENRYADFRRRLWVLCPCKECIKAKHRTEEYKVRARIRDKERYQNDPERHRKSNERVRRAMKKHQERNPLWRLNHERTDIIIQRLWIRPKVCPICWREWKIMAHHPDDNLWNEFVFCCQICHNKIHSWEIECPEKIVLPTNLIKTRVWA